MILSESIFLGISDPCLDPLVHTQEANAHSKIEPFIRDALHDAIVMIFSAPLQAIWTHWLIQWLGHCDAVWVPAIRPYLFFLWLRFQSLYISLGMHYLLIHYNPVVMLYNRLFVFSHVCTCPCFCTIQWGCRVPTLLTIVHDKLWRARHIGRQHGYERIEDSLERVVIWNMILVSASCNIFYLEIVFRYSIPQPKEQGCFCTSSRKF